MANKKETGAKITAIIGKATNQKEKINIEKILIDYAFDKLYFGQGLDIYRDIYVDSPAVTVLININDLPSEELDI